MKFLSDINFNKNQLQNGVLQPLSSAPSSPKAGQLYYNSSDKAVYYYDGTKWVAVSTYYFGECSTAGNTTAKTVSITGITSLTDGMVIHVRFANKNTATAPTLNVNSLGAYPIQYYGTTAVPINYWQDASIVELIYFSQNWLITATGVAYNTQAIPFGIVDDTSTATAFTATVPGITQLVDGTTVLLKNGVITSAAGFTIDINGLGAYPSYTNMAAATADSTIFNINYTMLFVFDSTRDGTGGWICYRGYNSNDNTLGYEIRTNSSSLPMDSVTYRYRLLFSNADCSKWVPANNSTSTNATASRTVIQTPINPFGKIVYYGTTTSVAADSRPSTSYLWEQHGVTLGYSFNRTGVALVLTAWKPLYLKCAPQTNGTVIIDSTTPYVQDLPTTEDGKVYLYLGIAYSETQIELMLEHPVFEYKNGGIRLWTSTYIPPAPAATTTTPIMDGTATAGTETAFARGDHVHPTDTSRAPLASPALTGIPTAPTAQFGEDTTQIATTAFVQDAVEDLATGIQGTYALLTDIPTKVSDLQNDSGFVDATGAASAAPVQSVNTYTGSVVLTASDVGALATSGGTVSGQLTLGNKLFLNSNIFGNDLPTDDYTAGRIFFKKVT